MEPIYVTGHRNPDTDSIVSAMAYAALQNAIGERDYVPARLGHISDETQLVLDRFGFEPPLRIQTMRTQVRDLDYDTPPALGCAVTMGRAWDALQSDRSIPAIPVVHDDGTLYGMISPAEIAAYDMQTLSTPCVQDIPVFNLLSVLDGKIINDAGYSVDRLSGEVTIAVPQSNPNLLFPGPESIVIVGEQPDVARRAIEQNVNCLIVCQAGLPEELREMPTKTCIIATPFDAFRAARMVYHAIEISRICRTDDLEAFHLSDFVDDVKEVVLKSRHRSYPILDENDKVVGTLSTVPSHQAAAQARRPRRPQRGGAVGARSRAGGHPRHHRPPPPRRYPDRRTDLFPERAGRLDGDDHRRNVSGAWTHALAEPRRADGGGHRGRHGHVQISDVHAARPPHGRAHGAHREHLARRAGP